MELLCIKTHSQKVVISGNYYPFIRYADSSQNDICDCTKECIDVGIKERKTNIFGNIIPEGTQVKCIVCFKSYTNTCTWWIHKSLFAIIDDETEELEQVNIKELELYK